ncbi:MAG: FAD-dependent monooxygenase [Pacificimonas sp.]
MKDHLVIGGGPAGAMLAAGLATRGKDVTLLERSSGPHHKVCGEFLSWEAGRMLRQAGVDVDALKGAPIDRLRLVKGVRQAETRLPGTATGISRDRLDEALLVHAAARGADIRRGVHVKALEDGGARLDDDSVLAAGCVWLATGKRDLRGAKRDPSGQKVTDGMIGFKLHLQLAESDAAAIASTIELHHFSGGYAGLQPIDLGRANLCLLADGEVAADGWDGVLTHLERFAPRLSERLARAHPLYDRPLAISRVPYGYIAQDEGQILRIGDQLAVIHSFTGDGMAIAIASGIAAGAGTSQAGLRKLVRPPVRRAAWGYGLLAGGGWPLDLVMRAPALAGFAARLTRVG